MTMQRFLFDIRIMKRNKRKLAVLRFRSFSGAILQHVLPKGFVKIRYFGLMGADQGHLQKQLKCLILKSISKKEQAAFLAIVFTPREREMRCRCCGSLLVLAEILKPSRGP